MGFKTGTMLLVGLLAGMVIGGRAQSVSDSFRAMTALQVSETSKTHRLPSLGVCRGACMNAHP